MARRKRSVVELTNDPAYVVVHTGDRYLRGETARVVSKKVLRSAVEKGCWVYQSGDCAACLHEEKELKTGCLVAWKLTVGKGTKLY